MWDFDWPRLSRWCLLGTILMVLWLLAPVVKCSWGAFRDTPIGEVQEQDDSSTAAGQADKDRLVEGTGFFEKFGSATKRCYRVTPLLGQEGWKTNLLVGLAALTVITRTLGSVQRRRKRTYGG